MPRPERYAWSFEAIGTGWQVDTAAELSAEVKDAVAARIEDFDRVWSRFRPDSLVTRMAEQAGTWHPGRDADALLGLYAELYDLTDGALTPLIGRTLSDLGYDADYSLTASDRPSPVPGWDRFDWSSPRLTTSEPVLFDVGAAGKGHLVDLVAEVLTGHGVHAYTIDASGDLRHCGGAPLRVGLEHPGDSSRAIGVAGLVPGRALCASATNRRSWGDGLHHVLDARTGRPVRDVVATWVVADSCLLADGLATAFFLAEPDRIMGRFDCDFVRMHADGSVEWSEKFPGEVFV